MTLKKNIIAFFVIGIAGTLGHFLYKWTGENMLVGLIFPINESTWEHLKLLFFPTVVYSVAEYFIGSQKPENYLPAVAISVICGMLSIVTLFYTISGIIGYNVDFINISIYFISIIVMLCKKRKIITSGKYSSKNSKLFFGGVLAVIALLFVVFSLYPPSIGIFTPPIM